MKREASGLTSWVEISRARLLANVRAVQAVAGPDVDVLAVIKADGYGHGAELIAPVLAGAGVPWLGVTDAEEGARVRARVGPDGPRILVMVGMEPADAPAMVEHGLSPAVWTPEHVEALERAAAAAGRRVGVQVEVDTGMSRQGAGVGADLASVLDALASARWVECEGVFTHFCESEVASSDVTAVQRARFEQALAQIAAAGVRPRLVHAANSSAVDEASTAEWLQRQASTLGARAMVRPGYALYGYALPVECGSAHLRPALQPVLTWKARVLGVREVPASATVGYGATFVAERPMRLALLPVGYADGFRRAASSGIGDGWVMLRGQRAPVVGRVSMNLTVVDVTGIGGAAVEDEAVLLGEGVTAEDHARWSGTLGYDILCGIRARRELC